MKHVWDTKNSVKNEDSVFAVTPESLDVHFAENEKCQHPAMERLSTQNTRATIMQTQAYCNIDVCSII